MQGINGVILDELYTNVLDLQRTGAYHSSCYSLYEPYDHLVVAADVLSVAPFWVPRASVWDQIAIYVDTADVGMDVRLGIFHNGPNMYPGDLLSDCGVVSVGGVGLATIAINIQLIKGLYYLAMLHEGTPHVWGNQGAQINTIEDIYTLVGSSWEVAQAYGALPDPFTGGGALAEDPPRIAMRLNSYV